MLTIIKPEYENCPFKAKNQKEKVGSQWPNKPMMFPFDGCDKVFIRVANLSTHNQIHSGEKHKSQHKREQHEEPFVYKSCEMCGRKFKRSKTQFINVNYI